MNQDSNPNQCCLQETQRETLPPGQMSSILALKVKGCSSGEPSSGHTWHTWLVIICGNREQTSILHKTVGNQALVLPLLHYLQTDFTLLGSSGDLKTMFFWRAIYTWVCGRILSNHQHNANKNYLPTKNKTKLSQSLVALLNWQPFLLEQSIPIFLYILWSWVNKDNYSLFRERDWYGYYPQSLLHQVKYKKSNNKIY